jgi:hypothetical protein
VKIQYIDKNFRGASLELIETANGIIENYQGRGYTLTLRQLYYQMVARDIIVNSQKSYDRLGSIINDARLAGLIDWNAIEDRTRNLAGLQDWNSPQQIVKAARDSYRIDHWQNQTYRPEVFVEKEALAGVVARACRPLDVDYMSCRGYMSQSEMHSAAKRYERYHDNEQVPLIIHLGDHDPSGIDMTRDITERLELFMGGLEVRRIALNYDQVEMYNPPPNPAKMTDSRFEGYSAEYGDYSWELDALDPDVLVDLITETVLEYRDEDIYQETLDQERKERALIDKAVRLMNE